METETPNAAQKVVGAAREGQKLQGATKDPAWRRWGPYLSDRQWGTVREDYSADGDAWNYFPHDHARSRAYRWGEDGLGGFADDKLRICMSVALWNGRDPILKERLFGLTNTQGNHGEDVKELYYFLDGVPSHSYMKMGYKYPQAAFPYDDLVAKNAARGLDEPEYELIDTGVFDENRYFDIEIEYAKAAPDDILLLITAYNRGPESETLHVLPHLWARNLWSWSSGVAKPTLHANGAAEIWLDDPEIGAMRLTCEGANDLLFCNNETNVNRLYGQHTSGYFKDGINEAVVNGRSDAVNSLRQGTKAAAHYVLNLAAGASQQIRVRLSPRGATPSMRFDEAIDAARADADAFYAALQAQIDGPDRKRIQRQAFAGMLWCKQFYGYDVRDWLAGDPVGPAPPKERLLGRNVNWDHVALGDVDQRAPGDVMSMPDSWEYPWFAAWDLAFHCVTFAVLDPPFAKSQLTLLTQARSLHPNGQMPAYEWNFSDVNPPIQAWAALQIYQMDRTATGVADMDFLERIFHKLMLNFTWWVNREDREGRNIFQGGFLGLDNIGLFDLRIPLPDGGYLDQSDATAWMSTYALNMMAIAIELSGRNRAYEDLATKFFEHFVYIAEAMHGSGEPGDEGLWDEQDKFYYDIFRSQRDGAHILRVRSIVGLVPLFAVEVLRSDFVETMPEFAERMDWFITQRPELARLVSDWREPNSRGFRLLSLLRRRRLNCVLTRMLDETEFLSDYGVRSLSKFHQQNPYTFSVDNQDYSVDYAPGEGNTRVYGGNSNWRGPIWMPINYLIVSALYSFHQFYGDVFQMECPTGSGNLMSLEGVAQELSRRIERLFLSQPSGRRAYLGESRKQWEDPHFQDRLQFHEYFHGENGKGLGASHQTGWTGLIALLMHPRETEDATKALSADAKATP